MSMSCSVFGDGPGSPASVDIAGVAPSVPTFVESGYRHIVFGFPSPYDEETMARLASEVRPKLAAAVGVRTS